VCEYTDEPSEAPDLSGKEGADAEPVIVLNRFALNACVAAIVGERGLPILPPGGDGVLAVPISAE
jgi:hypothetical protein